MLFKGNIDTWRIPEKLNQDGLWNEDEPWTGRESTSIHSDRRMEKRISTESSNHSRLITSIFSEK